MTRPAIALPNRRLLHAAAAACAAMFLALVATAVLAAGEPSFTIVSPAEDATVPNPVTIVVETTNATIGRPADGLDHLHYSIDGGPEVAIYKNEPITLELEPGQHFLTVDLAGPTHKPLLPEQTISFTVAN